MQDDTHTETIDWNRFWSTADDEDYDSATPSTNVLRDVLADFLNERGTPERFADVGCGPGVVSFFVADEYDAEVVGYDAAQPILEENRERARQEGYENVTFEHGVLPDWNPDGEFDLVLCFGTLCYVADSKRALQALYDAVAPGGTLLVGYTNRYAKSHYESVVENPPNPEEAGREIDPERFADRFSLVLSGESTLSYRDIHDALGTWPRSPWEVVEKPERWMWRNHPLVWVPK
ncbi:class I SAM-dependent methyltransferase [Salarchaeum sp. III]|uniref:class I SAM-dependent methyltransferase n=1 Tax=Salarchaeum sp. III TaxID=3107927 RepID=UPI002ED9F6A2